MAGGAAPFFRDGRQALEVALGQPNGIARDPLGNLYVVLFYDHVVVRFSVDGVARVVAGNGFPGFSGDGGPATSASLAYPWTAAVDAAGNLFIVDAFNYRIRRVSPDGIISTVAGNGDSGFSGDGGPATSASIGNPVGLAADAAGNLFITGHNRIRRVSPDGIISTIAGNGEAGFSGDGGPATSASFNGTADVVVDAFGNLFIADRLNDRIRRVSPDGIISTVAGNGESGFSGDSGPATSASLNAWGQATDAFGNLFIADIHDR